jgi:hypothetical protein
MKKLLLLISIFFLLGCEKEEEVLTPIFEISLDGESFKDMLRLKRLVVKNMYNTIMAVL